MDWNLEYYGIYFELNMLSLTTSPDFQFWSSVQVLAIVSGVISVEADYVTGNMVMTHLKNMHAGTRLVDTCY